MQLGIIQMSLQQKNDALRKAARYDQIGVARELVKLGATAFASAYGVACCQHSIRCEDYLKGLIIRGVLS